MTLYVVLFKQDELDIVNNNEKITIPMGEGTYAGYFPVFHKYIDALEAASYKKEYVIPVEQVEGNHFTLEEEIV